MFSKPKLPLKTNAREVLSFFIGQRFFRGVILSDKLKEGGCLKSLKNNRKNNFIGQGKSGGSEDPKKQ